MIFLEGFTGLFKKIRGFFFFNLEGYLEKKWLIFFFVFCAKFFRKLAKYSCKILQWKKKKKINRVKENLGIFYENSWIICFLTWKKYLKKLKINFRKKLRSLLQTFGNFSKCNKYNWPQLFVYFFSFFHFQSILYHIYRPLHSDRIWHKVNF